MAFQDEAADLLSGMAERVSEATDADAAGVVKLMEDLVPGDPAMEAIMRAAGDDLAALGRKLLVELGHRDLVNDVNAVMFVAMAALSSSQVNLTGLGRIAEA